MNFSMKNSNYILNTCLVDMFVCSKISDERL